MCYYIVYYFLQNCQVRDLTGVFLYAIIQYITFCEIRQVRDLTKVFFCAIIFKVRGKRK